MGEFKRKNVLQRMRMSTPELEVYYRNLRRYRFEQGYPLKASNGGKRRIVYL